MYISYKKAIDHLCKLLENNTSIEYLSIAKN